MADLLLSFQGTIDEFIGDAILAIFGAPVQREDDALRAVACAVEMQKAMERVNEFNRREGLPSVEMGIAIHTGEVVVGNIGSDKRAKYGVVGSPVNLTARIESYTVGGQILVSDRTRREGGGQLSVGSEVVVQMKGFENPVSAWDVRGVAGASTSSSRPGTSPSTPSADRSRSGSRRSPERGWTAPSPKGSSFACR